MCVEKQGEPKAKRPRITGDAKSYLRTEPSRLTVKTTMSDIKSEPPHFAPEFITFLPASFRYFPIGVFLP